MQNKSVTKRIKQLIATGALHAADKGANSACAFIAYQPKESDAVKRMRKF